VSGILDCMKWCLFKIVLCYITVYHCCADNWLW